MESTRKQLIDFLSNHQGYVSGQELSEQLNISRSAVWKHMNHLKKEGYQIEGITNKGYRIIEIPNQMNESSLQWNLQTKWLGQSLIYKESVRSTQLVAHDLARKDAKQGSVIVAGEQTSGRGRMRRHWDSKAGLGLWFSSILRPDNIEPKDASQLTLVAAVAIAQYLEKFPVDVKIKWPNDLFLNGKKLAGILTEMQAEQDAIQYIVLGIGMNINHTQDDLHETVKEKATSLLIETGESFNLNEVLNGLLMNIERKYELFIEEGFHEIKHEWEQLAYKMGEWIIVKTHKEWQAQLIGIHEDGALKVRDTDGQQHELYSAEILW
ncbi:biotin--[acetyl-CoA-carboxylase] ligase [Aquisalibacillus elongatus]|uniref:Bifunctional ligase/repressor BirA n=1 Tax=Aquisalibacillus elongatus TaxID=485577 RepID=A0A3N5C139_9BACI|nr:biotin--[acetyl-CoA-carboxylase] ligase [Aquisalibacillus elongatus]RPF55788.1 BirA family biotin operon repressor/biotin-[acetyl-CoA-carboxylase] ligase [Aquisalibacillus elongatus]